jgi:hypothetical protein
MLHRIRFAATAAAGLLLGLIGTLSTPAAALAANLDPAGEGTPLSHGATPALTAGLVGLELACLVLVGALIAVKALIRARVHRPAR